MYLFFFVELHDTDQVAEADEADRLLWEDEDTASPYFQSSCSTSGGSTQRRKAPAYKRGAKRRVRRKKRSPT